MKRRKLYKYAYLYLVSGMFVPFAILMMPEAKQTALLHLANWGGVIVLYVVFYLPMNLMLYTGYLKNVPLSLDEAAYVDGTSVWTAYWHIIFSNMKPMHATVAVLAALGAWNDVMTPLILMVGLGVELLRRDSLSSFRVYHSKAAETSFKYSRIFKCCGHTCSHFPH